MEQVEFPNVIDQYSDSCELGDGRQCFGPSIALQKFVTDCKNKHIVIVNGQAFRVKDTQTPIVLTLENDLYDKISSLAITKNLSPQEFLEIYAELLVDDEEVLNEVETDLEKIAETDTVFGEATYWDDASKPPPTDYGQEEAAPQRRIARGNSHIIKYLDDILNKIFDSAEDGLKVWMGFHRPGEVQLNIEYPEDGINIQTQSTGTLVECFEQNIKQLSKWESSIFGPKLEGGTDIKAELSAKIIEFDKSIGKYKVQLGKDIIVDIDPENISSIINN